MDRLKGSVRRKCTRFYVETKMSVGLIIHQILDLVKIVLVFHLLFLSFVTCPAEKVCYDNDACSLVGHEGALGSVKVEKKLEEAGIQSLTLGFPPRLVQRILSACFFVTVNSLWYCGHDIILPATASADNAARKGRFLMAIKGKKKTPISCRSLNFLANKTSE